MAAGIDKIKEELENTYDIPFTVKQNMEQGEPCYYIGPENADQIYFYIRVTFSNKIRITLELVPEKFGGAFVRRMGEHSKTDRENFLRFANIMTDRGAKMLISINNDTVLLEEFREYDQTWEQLKIRVTKSPVTEEKNFSYTNTVLEWASLMMGMVLSLADIVPLYEEEAIEQTGYKEGAKTQRLSNVYERNPINRQLCLERKGYSCSICGMNFENVYGEIGHNFIHVHHIVPVSEIGEGYVIDPERDLIPVCPNCHAMLHKKDPPYTPEELKLILQEQKR